ncbi:DUF4349 domain-containing protein [Thermoleophilia bacterium SCSIO 60948]|nr:DUF4349 domain-containing protein [Thermoleophilia bacterium SCSIO 60948]
MRLEDLETELRAERPETSERFSRELDEWAAAGFPREGRPGFARAPWSERVRASLRGLAGSVKPRHAIGSVGALAATIAIVTVVVSQAPNEGGLESGGDSAASSGESAMTTEAPAPDDEGGAVAGESSSAASSAAIPELADGQNLERLQSEFNYGVAQDVARSPDARKVERDADITLSSPADDVQGLADDVIGVVNAHDGIIESSQVGGRGDEASARFDLAIPTNELDATLDDLSALANVAELNEGSVDITKGFVSAQDELKDDRSALRSLRAQLEQADTIEETEALRAQVAAAAATVADSKAEFQRFVQRSRLSDVSVSIVSDESADTPGANDDEGGAGWGPGDALEDAGKALTVAAGVLVIVAAAALPLALVLVLILWGRSMYARRAHEIALDS